MAPQSSARERTIWINPYRYMGKRLDTGSAVATGEEATVDGQTTRTAGQGTVDMGARRFGPDTGQFLQRDEYAAALSGSQCLQPESDATGVLRGQAPRGIERVDLPHRGVPGSQPHITFSDDLPTLNLDGTWGHLGRGPIPNITNRQREWLERHEWPVPD